MLVPETVAGRSASSAGSAWFAKIGASDGPLAGLDAAADGAAAEGAAEEGLGAAAAEALGAAANDDAVRVADGADEDGGVPPPHATATETTAAASAADPRRCFKTSSFRRVARRVMVAPGDFAVSLSAEARLRKGCTAVRGDRAVRPRDRRRPYNTLQSPGHCQIGRRAQRIARDRADLQPG